MGTQQPAGLSKSSPVTDAGEVLGAAGRSVYAANMTAADVEAALRSLRWWRPRQL
ncbi:hypothetical protein ACGFZK_21670 [Streptomyces sp. NPDC048257]|uniref:hypothetical protein n=1 Tax=Streptomyces sp. NPDC048257 TaxID=3365526 RepID=UPI00371C5A03